MCLIRNNSQALSEEVADLANDETDITRMNDQRLLVFVSRLYPVLKSLSDAGLEPGLEGLLDRRILNTRDPKRRPIIQAIDVRDAVTGAFERAKEDSWLEEAEEAAVSTISPTPRRTFWPFGGAGGPSKTKPGGGARS